MIPTSDSFGRIIDCRTLVFDGQYFGLTESEVLGLDAGVSETTLIDLKRLKSALYSAMLPSVSEFDLDYPYLRSHWENIAVLDDELHVQDDKIILTQNGKADKNYLLKNT